MLILSDRYQKDNSSTMPKRKKTENCKASVQKETKPVTQQLVQFLSTVGQSELVSYQRLNEIACCDVKKKNRSCLSRAIEIVRRDYGVDLRCKHNLGYVRHKNEEISNHANVHHQSRLREDTKRYQQKIDCVDVAALPLQGKQEYAVAVTLVGIRNSLTRPQFTLDVRRELSMSPEKYIDRDKMLEKLKHFG